MPGKVYSIYLCSERRFVPILLRGRKTLSRSARTPVFLQWKNVVLIGFLALATGAGLLFPYRVSLQLSKTAAEDKSFSNVTDATPAFDASSSSLPIDAGVGSRYVLVSLAEQRLVAFEDSQAIFSAVVSTGSKKMSTPIGAFTIKNKAPMAYSAVAGLYMPFWMAFTKQDGHWLGFHELPEYPDGSKEGKEHLGQPYSGGCVRLDEGDAKTFYDWAQVGDAVLVY